MRRVFALVALALLVAPVSSALPLSGISRDHQYALGTTSSSLFAEVHYADGLASTKFAFVQLAGATGEPGQRLKPTPECTEWIGTFTQVALKAKSRDSMTSLHLRVVAPTLDLPLAAPRSYTDTPLDLQVVGGAGALRGSLLICDREGDGFARVSLEPVALEDPLAQPAVAHVSLEGF